MNEKKWFLMEHEEYGTRAAYVILSEDGVVVMNDCYNGFDEEVRRNIQNFMQQQVAKEQEQQRQQQVQSQKQPNQTQQSLVHRIIYTTVNSYNQRIYSFFMLINSVLSQSAVPARDSFQGSYQY